MWRVEIARGYPTTNPYQSIYIRWRLVGVSRLLVDAHADAGPKEGRD